MHVASSASRKLLMHLDSVLWCATGPAPSAPLNDSSTGFVGVTIAIARRLEMHCQCGGRSVRKSQLSIQSKIINDFEVPHTHSHWQALRHTGCKMPKRCPHSQCM